MLTFKDYTENYTCFTFTLLRFRSQNDVVYDTHLKVFHLNKSELIVCIKYILSRLSQLGCLDEVKHGFVLDNFKYFELSVYLHGLCQLYARLINLPSVGELSITHFSRLPHDVIKPVNESKVLEVALVNDFFEGTYYCCVVNGTPVCSHALLTLKAQIYLRFPSLKNMFDIILDVK